MDKIFLFIEKWKSMEKQFIDSGIFHAAFYNEILSDCKKYSLLKDLISHWEKTKIESIFKTKLYEYAIDMAKKIGEGNG